MAGYQKISVNVANVLNKYGSQSVNAVMDYLTGGDNQQLYGPDWDVNINTKTTVRSGKYFFKDEDNTHSSQFLFENQMADQTIAVPALDNVISGSRKDTVAFLKQGQDLENKDIDITLNRLFDPAATNTDLATFDNTGRLVKVDANQIIGEISVGDATETTKGIVEFSKADGSESAGGRAVQDNDPRLGAQGGGGPHTHDWADVTGEPATYAPSAHSHLWSNIADPPATYAPSSHAYSSHTGIPATFPPSAHQHSGADITSGTVPANQLPLANTTTRGAVVLATDGESNSAEAVASNDARLSNARTPLAHSHLWANITDPPATYTPSTHQHSGADITSGTVPAAQLPTANTTTKGAVILATDGESNAAEAVAANDSRLSNARTPLAHTHLWADTTDKPSTFPPSAHSHLWANITDPPNLGNLGGTLALSSISTSGAADGEYLKYTTGGGVSWEAGGDGGGLSNVDNTIGTGEGHIFKEITDDTIYLKTIKAGANVSITNNADDITINSVGGEGGNMTGDSLGAGEGEVFKDITGGTMMNFRSLNQGTNIQISQDANEITIAAAHNHDSAYAALSHNHLWANITDPPATYAPSAHSHLWANITDPPATYAPSAHSHTLDSLSDVVADSPADMTFLMYNDTSGYWEGTYIDYEYLANKPTTFAPSAHASSHSSGQGDPITLANLAGNLDWSRIDNEPATYAPSAHSHLWVNITDPPATYAPSAHTHLWADTTDKPTEFTPSAHNHNASAINAGTLAVAQGGLNKNSITEHALLKGGAGNTYVEIAPSATDGQVLTMVTGTPAWADPTGEGGGITESSTDILTNKTLADTVASGNKVSVNSFHDFAIYLEGTSIIARNNWTGEKTSFPNTDVSDVIEFCVDSIIDQSTGGDSIYLGSVCLKKGHFIGITPADINKQITNNRHGVVIIGQGLGTTLEFQGTSGQQLDAGFKVSMSGCEITNMRIVMNEYVTQAIHQWGDHANTGFRTDQNIYSRLQIEGPTGNGGMFNPDNPFVVGQRGIIVNGSAIATFFTRVIDCDFIGLEVGVWAYGPYATTVRVDRCDFIACEYGIIQSDGSGQNKFTNLFIQGTLKAGTNGIDIRDGGKNTIIDNVASEINREIGGVPTDCQTVLLNAGVTDTYISNCNNVWDGYVGNTTSKTIRDNSGDILKNFYGQTINVGKQNYMIFENNIVKTNSAIKYNYFSGQQQFYDASYDHYWKFVNNAVELDADREIGLPAMTQNGNMMVTNAVQTVSGKIISPLSNTMPYIGPTAFSIHPHGGYVQLRNNGDGTTAQYDTLDDALAAVFANTNDPSAVIHSGWYDLPVDFSGFVPVSKARIYMMGSVYINVPEGYTGQVWKMHPNNFGLYYIHITGGVYDEQGVNKANNWDLISIVPTGTGHMWQCKFENMIPWRCQRPIYIHTHDNSWVNQNKFIDIYAEVCEYIGAVFEHTGTYTENQSGPNGNLFIGVSGQASAGNAAEGYKYPRTLGGFKDVVGNWNEFIQCNPWDLYLVAESCSMNITANARGTKIEGGLVCSQNFVDNGKMTTSNEQWYGMVHKNELVVKGREENWSAGITVKKTPSEWELVAQYGIDGSPDKFTVENGLSSVTFPNIFVPIWRAQITSDNAPAGIEALHLGSFLKNSLDTGDVPTIKLAGRTKDSPFYLANRPIVGISNYADDEYLFYKDRLDMNFNNLVDVGAYYGNDIFSVTVPAEAGVGEDLFVFSVAGASGDSFSLSNSTSIDNAFCPYFVSHQESAAVTGGLVGMYFESIVKTATDTGGTNFCNVISGRRADGNQMTTRGLFAVTNKWDPEFGFYPDRADWYGNALVNAVVNTTDMSLTATSQAVGDLLVNNGSKFVRKGRGTGLQVLRTNSGGTDVEWASLDNMRVGKSTANGGGSSFTIPHGLGATPTYAFVTMYGPDIMAIKYSWDGTNITVTTASNTTSGTGNVLFQWWVIA